MRLPTSVEQLRALVVELMEVIAAKDQQIAAAERRIANQEERIAELERRLGADSSTSNRPPSLDSPYRKPVRRSSRKSSGRRPGKQPGDPGTTMPLVNDPDEVITYDPGRCGGCGAELSGAPVVGVQRRQVVEVTLPPAPRVTEYQIVTRACAGCGAMATASPPGCPPARVQYGPTVAARAAELVCAHYLPVARATRLMRSMVGVPVSVGFMASVRGRAARMLERTFLPRVRELLREAGVLHVDETPARAAGGLGYVHVAATAYLTALHTGGRSAADIDAGGVLPGYTGTMVRDGYAGYAHLIDAHHAWCGAHLLRDLRAVHDADLMANSGPLPWPPPSPMPLPPRRPPAPPDKPPWIPRPWPPSATTTAGDRQGHHRQQRPRRTPGPRRTDSRTALPRPRRDHPALRGRSRRALH